MDVRKLVEHLRRPLEIVRMPAEVRGQERRVRMAAEEVVTLGHQLLESHTARLVVAAIPKQRKLEPALILHIERREELLRLRGMNERWNPEAAKRLPDRVEIR